MPDSLTAVAVDAAAEGSMLRTGLPVCHRCVREAHTVKRRGRWLSNAAAMCDLSRPPGGHPPGITVSTSGKSAAAQSSPVIVVAPTTETMVARMMSDQRFCCSDPGCTSLLFTGRHRGYLGWS